MVATKMYAPTSWDTSSLYIRAAWMLQYCAQCIVSSCYRCHTSPAI